MSETRCKCGHPDADHHFGKCWREPLTDRCACERYEPETTETTMRPKDVPEELIDLAMTGAKPGCRSDAAFYLANVLPAHEAMVRRAYHAELFGTPEEIRQREIEAKANAKPDDPIELCERIRPGLHEQRVRVKVAEELRADADAHRRLIARKPSRHDEVRLARARTLDDAAARITRGEQP